ncbi:EamA family transporter [Agromyces sp. ISL-38]|uniref:EamA family transporter n=1 Tax=Agromyces sp. ISL-38 TaxID=2819107 RepID=UPI001BEBA803|nr:EamA family transporter [Agromyces sp. ISL-38]MBT2499523.1 EamA family transporter [Agromyces sp. ISL-38]MBT2516344.1 EamA family transporter [Streptomyces sp. ISL-90]
MARERIAASAAVGGAVSVQIGAAIGATIFPLVGPAGVVALRQAVAAIALIAVARPRLRGLRWSTVRPAILLGLVLVVMNLTLYGAVERIGLGLAVTLEFLGPLAVALLGSRRRFDLVCAALAGVGVVLLTGTVPGLDVVGILLGLAAAAAWAAYILLSQRAGRSLPGIQGTAIASLVAAILTSPILVIVLVGLDPHELLRVAVVGLAAGILSSAIPYSIDLLVLRRLPRQLFGVLQSVHPAAAAVAGLVVLGQTLGAWQIAGLVLITAGNAIAVGRGTPSASPPARRRPAEVSPIG